MAVDLSIFRRQASASPDAATTGALPGATPFIVTNGRAPSDTDREEREKQEKAEKYQNEFTQIADPHSENKDKNKNKVRSKDAPVELVGSLRSHGEGADSTFSIKVKQDLLNSPKKAIRARYMKDLNKELTQLILSAVKDKKWDELRIWTLNGKNIDSTLTHLAGLQLQNLQDPSREGQLRKAGFKDEDIARLRAFRIALDETVIRPGDSFIARGIKRMQMQRQEKARQAAQAGDPDAVLKAGGPVTHSALTAAVDREEAVADKNLENRGDSRRPAAKAATTVPV